MTNGHISQAVWTALALVQLVLPSGCNSTSAPRTEERHSAVSPNRQTTAASGIPDVDPAIVYSHVALLAHDELGGRGTGSDGIDMAAGYIAGQFAAMGLLPGGPQGTYFQSFTIPSDAKLRDETKLTVDGLEVQPKLREDFIPFGFSARGSFDGDVVFVGYGISDAEKHDDYAAVDVSGKVVLMLRREPPGMADGGRTSRHATFDSKMALAIDKGAVAVLIVNNQQNDDDSDVLTPFGGRGKPKAIPALHISRTLGDELVRRGGLKSLSALQKSIDENHDVASAPLDQVHVGGEVAYELTEMIARNVIGVLPGTGPRAGEFIVIGGHYDHLGTRRREVYNGADDNASGTAGVMEVCRVLSRLSYRDRSVLCMAYSAEEIGLLGSKHYVEQPTVPINAIVAMINMDMIGRWTPDDEANKLAIHGLGTGASFKEIIDRRTAEAGIEYLLDPSAKGPSDHASFYEGGVPSLFFFTGVHADYHQPGDDTEKVNVAGAARIASLVSRVALDLVNAEAAPVFAKVDQPARIFRGAAVSGGGVVIGVMPDMEDESDEPGWRIAQVIPGGGAAKGGMIAGDRIVKIDDLTINSMSDYRKATAEKKPGDTISVVVRRGKDEVTLSIELSSRG